MKPSIEIRAKSYGLSLVLVLPLIIFPSENFCTGIPDDSPPMPTLVVQAGHLSVQSVAFSPDGGYALSGNSDDTLTLWDIKTGSEIRTFTGHSQVVLSVAFSSDGRYALSGSGGLGVNVKPDETVRLWDIKTGSEIKTFTGHSGSVRSVAFSPDGKSVLSGSDDRTLTLWDIQTGKEIRTFIGHSGSVRSVAFSPDGKSVLSGSDDRTLKLWDIQTGTEVRAFKGHSDKVTSVVISPDGKRVLSGGDGRTLKLWDIQTGMELRTFIDPSRSVLSVAFSPDGRYALSGGYFEPPSLWDINTGVVRPFSRISDSSIVASVTFSPDGRYALSGNDFELRLWDVKTGEVLRQFKGNANQVFSAAFSPDGKHALIDSLAKGIGMWDLTTGAEVRQLRDTSRPAYSDTVSPDGKYALYLCMDDRTAFALVDKQTGTEVRRFKGHSSFVTSYAFSPNGKNVLSGSWDKTLRLWAIDTGTEIRRFIGHSNWVTSVVFSADGTYALSAGTDHIALIWNVATGEWLAKLVSFEDGTWMVVAPDGRFDTNNLDEINGLSWVFPDEPMRALPPEIFMRNYYVPKLLPKALGGEKLPGVRALADLNRAQPQVEMVKVAPEGRDGLVSVTVQVSGTQSEVQKDKDGRLLQSGCYDLHLFRDGQLVGQWPEVSEAAESSFGSSASKADLESWRKLHEIKLLNGEYTHTFLHIRLPRRDGVGKVQFTAYAFNSDRVKSLITPPMEYSIPETSPVPRTVVSRRAFLISMGVNANQSRWNLDFAVPSAQDAARLLHAKLAKDYEVVDISLFSTLAPDSPRVLLQQATKANLKAVLDLLAGRPVNDAMHNAVDPNHMIQPATPDDAVVLVISSHGYADQQGTFYVVPYDTGTTFGLTEDVLTRCQAHLEDRSPACQRANVFLEHTISSQDFTAWWAGVDAGEMVMILDSCHSGAVPGREFRPAPLGDPGFGQLSYDKGMRILTATQPDKTARATLMQELGHSLLVEALLEEAKAHPQETLAQWLRDTEQQVPLLTHRLYPELREADVQLPELFDFSVTERHQSRQSAAEVSR